MKRTYPYQVRTDKSIRPETINPERYGHFRRVSDPNSNEALWGFENETGRDLFYQEHQEKVIK